MESGIEHTLASYLAAARQQAGAPSLRAIAARTDYSHTTVGKAFGSNDPSLLQWAIVEQITTALGASTDTAQGLWASANEAAADPEPAAGGHPHGRMVITYGWCAVLLTGGIVIAMVQSVDRNVAHTTFVTDLAQLLFIAGTAVAFARHAVTARRRGDRLSLTFFLWLTAGALAWTAGQALWFTARNIDDQLIPSGHLHDVWYLVMPVCMGVALWMRAGRLGLMDVSRSAQRLFSVVCVLGGSYATTVMIMSLLHLQIAGFELLAALYPATDLTLAFLAAIPLVFGRRIVGSIILSTAFLAAAASDMAYLLLKANPSTEMMAPQAALGYIGFTIMLSLYTTVSQPLPDRQTRRQKAATAARARVVIDTVTAISTIGAAICAAIVLWSGPTTEVGIAAFVAIVTVATACAVRMALNSANPAMSSRARTDSPSLA